LDWNGKSTSSLYQLAFLDAGKSRSTTNKGRDPGTRRSSLVSLIPRLCGSIIILLCRSLSPFACLVPILIRLLHPPVKWARSLVLVDALSFGENEKARVGYETRSSSSTSSIGYYTSH
jgi:hypothetical protein